MTAAYKSRREASVRQEKKQDVIDREVETLTASLGHVPTNVELLRAASDVGHPLHAFFEWDDQRAAQKWRLEEAHRMLQSCKFVVEMNERESKRVQVRKLVVINRGEPMRLRNEALAEPDARQKLKAHAIGELRSWCRRYVDLPEVELIRAQLEKMI